MDKQPIVKHNLYICNDRIFTRIPNMYSENFLLAGSKSLWGQWQNRAPSKNKIYRRTTFAT